MNESTFILCPRCNKKTSTKIEKCTVMEYYLLLCRHCKIEFVINVKCCQVSVIEERRR